MAHILFSVSFNQDPWPDVQQERLPGKIRLSIFLIAGVCGSLPVLAWALHVFYRHYNSAGRISAFVVMLLLCDLLVLFLTPYVVTNLLQAESCWDNMTCKMLSSLWAGSETYGLHLQQVVGLEGALALRNPIAWNYSFFHSCSIILSIVALLCFSLCEFFSVDHLVLLGLPLLFTITLTSWIVTCRAPPHISDGPCTTWKSSSAVLALVTFTLVLYVIFASMCLLLRNYSGHYQNPKYWNLCVTCLSLMSLRVVFDPLLCVLVHRRNLRVQTQQNTHRAYD
ncbi:uncharacterized protein LOC118816903 [Colossoma macropomum]|uniref:uncharacterized protein LOC118816903 n=1 Tax=Colossoma macropomum TaxID=42526 RepID=UPI001865637E|nr:uncharacterized protein LOC118816903 [Colossoma macropomum]